MVDSHESGGSFNGMPDLMNASPTSPFVSDVHAQPQALADLLDAGLPDDVARVLDRLDGYDRIVMTGMGSSDAGTYPAFLSLIRAGLPAWHVDSADLLGYGPGFVSARSLVWITSQSGESAEAVALLDKYSSVRPVVLGMTEALDSTLAKGAATVLPLRCGNESSVSTRSYVNTLAASQMAVDGALGRDARPSLRNAVDSVAEYLIRWDEHVSQLGNTAKEPILFVLGRGSSLAAARTGALIVKEASHHHAEGMSTPQFRHGPLDMAGPDTAVFLLAGGEEELALNQRMRETLAAVGANTIWLDPNSSTQSIVIPQITSDTARPIAEILPFQALATALAQRSGREPGRFSQIGKVTTVL